MCARCAHHPALPHLVSHCPTPKPTKPCREARGLSPQVLWELGERMTEKPSALGPSHISLCFGDPNLGSHPTTWAAEQLCGPRQIPPPLWGSASLPVKWDQEGLPPARVVVRTRMSSCLWECLVHCRGFEPACHHHHHSMAVLQCLEGGWGGVGMAQRREGLPTRPSLTLLELEPL